MNYRRGLQRVYAVLTVACAVALFALSCSPVNRPEVADLTAVQLFDLRSKCADLGKKILEEDSRASRVSHYEPRTNRCFVQTYIFLGEESRAEVNLYDGQTKELLISVKYKDGQPTWANIFMENWRSLADSLGDPELSNKTLPKANPPPNLNTSIAETLMKRLMQDERLPAR